MNEYVRNRRVERDDLGRFVEYHEYDDGVGYFLCIPPNVRPEGWRERIPLPTAASGQKGHHLSPEERVMLDAKRLNADVDFLAAAADEHGATLAHVAVGWINSDRWCDLGEDRQKSARYHINHILRWSADLDYPSIDEIKLSEIETFLKSYRDRPYLKIQLQGVLSVLFDRAGAENLVAGDPIRAIKWKVPVKPTNVWTEEDVRSFVEVATARGRYGLAGVICTMWYTGQRAGDVRAFRHGVEYVDGHLAFTQSKTGRAMRVPVVAQLAEVIELARTDSQHLFTGERGAPFTRASLSSCFSTIRGRADFPGSASLQLRALRHSCVMRLARAGASPMQIASITGHAIAYVAQQIEAYFGADDVLTRQALELDILASGGDLSALPEPSSRFARHRRWTADPAKEP